MSGAKEYLGDGVYAEADTYGVVLTAENGVEVSDRIYLELPVLRALDRFCVKEKLVEE